MPFNSLSKIGTGISYVITGLAVALFSWANSFIGAMPDIVSVPLGWVWSWGTWSVGKIFEWLIVGDADSVGEWIIDNPGFDTLIVGGAVFAGAKVYSAIKGDIKDAKREEIEKMKEKVKKGKEGKSKIAESDKKIIEGMILKYEKEIGAMDPDEETSDEDIEKVIEEGFHNKISGVLSYVDKRAFKEEEFRNEKAKNILEYLKNTNKGKDNKVDWLNVKKEYKGAIYKFNIEGIREKLISIKDYI